MTSLDQYYKEKKNDINSSIMEIACNLAVAQLVNKYNQPNDTFLQPENPNDPDNGCTRFKEEYQDEFDLFYYSEYNRIAKLMKFDFNTESGQMEEFIESKATEVKTAYATVRYDIENITGIPVSDENIDDVLSECWEETKNIGDFIVSISICERNDDSNF